MEQVIGLPIVGDEQVDSVVIIDIDGNDAEAPTIVVDEPRLGGHVGESSLSSRNMIGQRFGFERVATGVGRVCAVLAEG